MGWLEYGLAFLAFFVSHSVPVRPPIKAKLVDLLGARRFSILYSLLSLGILGWLISAAGRAPYIPLWDQALWQSHLALTIMALVCLILALAIGRPNPFSFGGARNDTFDPRSPGLVRWIRHPLLAALALWAGAHLIANGDLAHVILFGLFAAFAVLGMWIIDRRKQRLMRAEWQALWTQVSAQTLLVLPRPTLNLFVRLGAALALYAGLLMAHPILFGVSPVP